MDSQHMGKERADRPSHAPVLRPCHQLPAHAPALTAPHPGLLPGFAASSVAGWVAYSLIASYAAPIFDQASLYVCVCVQVQVRSVLVCVLACVNGVEKEEDLFRLL